jgi:hypothetical protein
MKCKILLEGTTYIQCAASGGVFAVEPAKDLNLYSARRYPTDGAVYGDFIKQTGVKHISIFGGMVRHVSHSKEVFQLMEYLASNSAQEYFAHANHDCSTGQAIKVDHAVINAPGNFQQDNISVSVIGKNQIAAQQLLDLLGYQ